MKVRPQIPSETDILALFTAAVSDMLKEDKHLFENNNVEWSVSAKLGCYLAESFPEWKADCENARFGKEVKRINGPKNVRPDITVHIPGEDGPNLLVVEVKKFPYRDDSAKEEDCYIIRELIQDARFKYQYGIFISFTFGSEPKVHEAVLLSPSAEGEVQERTINF